MQVTLECFALDPCSYLSVETGIQGKKFAVTLHYWTQSRYRNKGSIFLKNRHFFIQERYNKFIQLTLVILTSFISILSLLSNWFLSPDYFFYVFFVFQLCICQTTFMWTLRLSVHHFQSLNIFFTVFTTAYLELRAWRREEKNERCGTASFSVNEIHDMPLIN